MTGLFIAEIATRQLADYDARQPGRIFEDPAFTLSVTDAVAVQRQVAALRVARGEAIAGYKIGCVSEAVQRQLGTATPVFGHLFESEVYGSGVSVDAANFCCLAVEGELAVRIGSGSGIVSLFPVIELHNNLLRGSGLTAQELIANNALHAGLVLPPREIRCTDLSRLSSVVVTVYRDGKLLGSAHGDEIPGGPARSVAEVSRHLKSFGEDLKPGHIVLTGSPLPLYPVSPGDHIVVCGPESAAAELFVR